MRHRTGRFGVMAYPAGMMAKPFVKQLAEQLGQLIVNASKKKARLL
jgi:hypothetical protein